MKTQQPLLTVIVPCYNVEKYLDRCISSIVNQTYSNLEILLVDDGSTDETGARCDMWQEKDQRIRVLHKKNEGVSIARNTGIKKSTADYVAFVDADDWIDKNMYTDLMTALLSTHSDIAHCDYCTVYENGKIEYRVHESQAAIETMNRVKGVLLIFEDDLWRTNIWTKIYKKSLFDHIEFHQGRIFGEDMAIVHLLFHQASKTVLLNNTYYFYCQRNDSACRKGSVQKETKKIKDSGDTYFERYSFVKEHPEYHRVLPLIKLRTVSAGLNLLHNIIKYPQHFTDNYFNIKAKQLSSILYSEEDNWPRLMLFKFYLLKISPRLYKFVIIFYSWVIHVINWFKDNR